MHSIFESENYNDMCTRVVLHLPVPIALTPLAHLM